MPHHILISCVTKCNCLLGHWGDMSKGLQTIETYEGNNTREQSCLDMASDLDNRDTQMQK